MDGFQELARNTSERFQVVCEFECGEPVLLDEPTAAPFISHRARGNYQCHQHGKAKRIKISLKKTSDEIALTVGDDGIGLPENGAALKAWGCAYGLSRRHDWCQL